MNIYTMLIVDDNNKDRRIVRDLVDWEALGVELCAEASNGKIALEMLEKTEFDIMITDISMPVMNGVNLVKEARQRHPKLKVIFMSYHEEFDYAKSAIEMSIYGYVLKPIQKNELENVVLKVLDIYKHEETSQSERMELIKRVDDSKPVLKKEFFRALIFGLIPDPLEVCDKCVFFGINEPQDMLIQVLCVLIVGTYARKSIREQYILSYTLEDVFITETDLAVYNVLVALQVGTDEYAIVVSTNHENDGLQYATSLYTHLTERLGVGVVIGLSLRAPLVTSARALYEQSQNSANISTYSGGIPIIQYKEVDESARSGIGSIDDKKLYMQVEELLLNDDDSAIDAFLSKYISEDESDDIYLRYISYAIVTNLQIFLFEQGKSYKSIFDDSSLIWKRLDELHSMQSVRNWLKNIITTVKSYIGSFYAIRNVRIVKEVKDLIASQYSEQITLSDISKKLFMSAKQLNSIFKKETGNTIFEYLIEYRIRMASQLLLNPNVKIYEVCEQVGYSNKSYFTLLFKNVIGQTPTEYRDSRGYRRDQ